MCIKTAIYNILVNRHPGISIRYHRLSDGSGGAVKLLSWIYLLWLNFAFYILQFRFLGRVPGVEIYESRRLDCGQSESGAYLQQDPELTVENYVGKLSRYDVISFDVFDTLIFRPLALPEDLFYLIGCELGILDLKNLRVWAEWDAREKYNVREGNREVSLSDIWDDLEAEAGISSRQGQETEKAVEQKLCYANPFMLEVWKRLTEQGKKIIIVSDMYLPQECIGSILERAGYIGARKIYVSNEYHKSKADGRLYQQVLSDLCGDDNRDGKPSIIHVGDNPHSDMKQAEQAGLEILPYGNVNKNALLYRAFDMSPLIGSAYRAIVSNWLYSGLHAYSMEYEYGFIYGGLFVLGYCTFIHDQCREKGIDKLLFLSRDGDVLKQAYGYLYPDEPAEYVYWSRKAATKLEAVFDKHDYFRRFLFHKVNQGYTIREILHSMELDLLAEQLYDWRKTGEGESCGEDRTDAGGEAHVEEDSGAGEEAHVEEGSDAGGESRAGEDPGAGEEAHVEEGFVAGGEACVEEGSGAGEEAPRTGKAGKRGGSRQSGSMGLKADDKLTDRNAPLLRQFIEAKWEQVLKAYGGQDLAAKTYFEHVLKGVGKAAAVDIGWAGSGAMVLRHLVDKEWKLPCEVIGIIAGTNTVHNAEPDASESFLQSGQLVAYLYSQSHNRDLLKKHDQNKGYNIFWELLLSSPTPQFKGFYKGSREEEEAGKNCYLKSLDITLAFGKCDANLKGIREIQKGIMDFVKEYHEHFKDFPYMFHISGRDAYAPMLVAASHNERYLKEMEKRFHLEINVD